MTIVPHLQRGEATSSPPLVEAKSGTARPFFSGAAMVWVYLFAAGILEIVWSYAMKQSHGFTRPWPTVLMAATMLGSFGLLALAMRSLPLGTAYAIWTGIGAVGAFVVGVVALGEQASILRLIAAGLIVSGIVTMKVAGPP